jgi:hypothetical protein
MMTKQSGQTLRLNLPQWQGGNQPEYRFGAQLLAWLAPKSAGPVETVTVPEAEPGEQGRMGKRSRGTIPVVAPDTGGAAGH